MEQNKVRTYLLYAIGEIALVMIGILLALQVSNWNEEKRLETQEKIYLKLILDDLELQKEENETQRSALSGHLEIEDQLTDLIVKRFVIDRDQQDEAKKVLSTLLVGRTYGAYEATYIDLTSSGNIGLISDQKLKNRIIQHYQIQKRDRDVINNNTLNTYLEVWSKLVDRDLIFISPNLQRYASEKSVLDFNPKFNFLDAQLFENLAEENNLILLQNVLGFKIAASGIATTFLKNSDERIDRLINELEIEIQDF